MVGCLDMVFTELTMLPNENKMKKPQNVSNRYQYRLVYAALLSSTL